MSPTRDTTMNGRRQSVVVTVVGVVLVAHGLALALFLAPSGPVRESVGPGLLASYVDPYFRQGDDSVGLGSNRVDETLSLRAYVRPDGGGKATFTAWVDVTAAETDALRGSLLPSRARQISRRLAANLNFSMFDLTSDQRTVVAAMKASDSSLQIQQRLISAGDGDTASVQNFTVQDRMASQYASLWLAALHPDVELLQVQYRVGRRVVPDFAERADTSVGDVAFDWFSIGWRPAVRANTEARSTFDQYVMTGGDLS